MDGPWLTVLQAAITAIVGVFLLASGVQGWFVAKRAAWFIRIALVIAALFMIQGGLLSDAIGITISVATFFIQKFISPDPDAPIPVRGAD